jgi:hypothetical protein
MVLNRLRSIEELVEVIDRIRRGAVLQLRREIPQECLSIVRSCGKTREVIPAVELEQERVRDLPGDATDLRMVAFVLRRQAKQRLGWIERRALAPIEGVLIHPALEG